MIKPLSLIAVALAIGCGGPPATSTSNAPAPTTEPATSAGAGQGTTTSGLAVLVPEELARQESTGPGFAVADTHYTVTQRDEQMTLSLTGSLVSREEASIKATPGKPAGTLRGVPVYVTENEGIKTATWIENGTAYALDIECTSDSDKRCTSPDYVMNVIKGLVAKAPR
jgi:hypothetical protein